MKARDLMQPVPGIGPEDDAADLVAFFRDPNVRTVAVVTDVDELVGVVSDEDMLAALIPSYVRDDENLARVLGESAGERLVERLAGKRVKNVVDATRRDHAHVEPDDNVVEVALAMATSSAPAVLVVEDRRVLGVIPVDVLLPALLGSE